jgi:hypothetical protein
MDDFEECWQLLGRLTPPAPAERLERQMQERRVADAMRQICAAGAIVFVEGGWLKVRSHDGTITNVAPV